jgi:L-amino acid N-acyltransferase YncA
MRLRFARAEDGDRLAEIYRPAVAERATSFELAPPTGADMAGRVTRTLARTPWLVAEAAEAPHRVLGYAYASAHKDRAAYQWSVDVSTYVDPSAHRGGVGRALYTTLFEILRLQGFVNAYAGITLPNPASEGFHRAMGFEPVGVYRQVGYKLGDWHDVAWLSLALAEHGADPRPPRPLPEVRKEAEALLASAATAPARDKRVRGPAGGAQAPSTPRS